MKINIEYDGRTQRAEIPDHSDLAYHLQDHGPVAAAVKERVYYVVYLWLSDKGEWRHRSTKTDHGEAQKMKEELKEKGKKVRVLETTDPSKRPEDLEDEGDKPDQEYIDEWKQYNGMGDKAARHAYQDLGPIDQADLDQLESVKYVGDATAENVRQARDW